MGIYLGPKSGSVRHQSGFGNSFNNSCNGTPQRVRIMSRIAPITYRSIGQLAYWMHRTAPDRALPREIAEPYALMIEGQWQAAADAWNVLEAPYERALALADGPEAALREALALLEQLGAGPLQAIVRQRLRDLGVRGLPRGPRASTRAHPAGLTSREVQVLNLLVHGHTNTELARRLHLSTKTVDHHVSAILEKLQARSRTEAVAAAFGLGIIKAAR